MKHKDATTAFAAPVQAPIEFDAATASALFTISTPSQDRDGDIVMPEGCLKHLDSYKANPVVLFDHGVFPLPVALSEDPSTKLCTVNVMPDRITARAFFHCDTLESSQVCRLVDKRVLRAASIGFNAIKGQPVNPNRPRNGSMIEDWELVEWSIVPVPANGEALRMALSAKWEGKALAEPIAQRFKSLLPAKTRTIVSMAVKSGESPRKKAMAEDTTIDTPEMSDDQDSSLLAGAQGVKILIDGLQAAMAAVEEVRPTIENDKVIKLLEKCIGKIKATSDELQNAAAAIYPDVFETMEATPAEEETAEEEEEVTPTEEDKGDDEEDVSNLAKSLNLRKSKAWQEECSSHIDALKDTTELLDDMSKSPNIPSGYKRQCKGVLPGLTGMASWIKGKADAALEDHTEGKDDAALEQEPEAKAEMTGEEEAEAVKALEALMVKTSKNARELSLMTGAKA